MRFGFTMTLALLVLAAGIIGAEEKTPRATLMTNEFGKMPDGTPVEQFTLSNGGVMVKIITLGGIITELYTPDRDGNLGDIVLGFNNLDAYLKGHPYFGCITGRYCNRIAKGKFTLDGKEYTLAVNNEPNHLHGVKVGFDKVVWKATPIQSDNVVGVKLTRRSPDGEEGYPGNLDVTVQYLLNEKGDLEIRYEATTDKATPLNLTNHSYFNLGGINGGDILNHELKLNADRYTPTDNTLIPTGEIKAVKGTPFDFTEFKKIGKEIAQAGGDPVGYDLNFALNRDGKEGLVQAAMVRDPKSGRTLEILTTEPGIQFYTGNFLDGTLTGKGGVVYKKHYGFCLETQHFPDSPNQPDFPSTILKPGVKFTSTTVHKFGVMK